MTAAKLTPQYESIEDYCIRAGRVHPWATEAGIAIKSLKAENARLVAERDELRKKLGIIPAPRQNFTETTS